jgi:hypothetical protein
MNKTFLGWIVIVLLVVPLSAFANQLTVSSYSMYNGATGSFNYRDFTYSPCNGGVCDTTGALLSGGTGKLTDGNLPSLSWYQYGGSTPWVGWDVFQGGSNPTVTFNFNGTVHIDSVTVWVDNTIGAGGVYLPSSIFIDGQSFSISPDNVNPNPRAYTFSGLNINASNVNVQFFQSSYQWLMVGEVSFDDGTTRVPEPGTMFLLGLGLFGLAGVKRGLKR